MQLVSVSAFCALLHIAIVKFTLIASAVTYTECQ
jgi:hypothetical protein